jgi:DNA-binding transcriptional LysR family regulator
MDEEQLRTFVAIRQSGTITGATAKLHRTQPAVSRRLAQLESHVGASLFDRTTDGMRLSAAGHALLPFAEAALAAIEDGRRAVRSLHAEDRGPLAIAIVGTLAGSWLTRALRDFAAAHPAVDLTIQTANSAEVLEYVRRGDATFGIGYAQPDDPVLTGELLFHEQLVVACAPDHPRAGRRATALDALRDERWLAFANRPSRLETSARFISGHLAAAGIPASAIHAVDSLTAQKRLVEAGFGIALMPESSITDELAGGTLATIPAKRLGYDVIMTARRHAYLSHAARTLHAELNRAAKHA